MQTALFGLDKNIRISPSIWPDKDLAIQPGDLSRFVPHGNGVYGYQNHHEGNPFTNAPSQEACGGVVYFRNDVTRLDFEALMRIMKVRQPTCKGFAVFTAESKKPDKDGYLVQMRIVSKFGLQFMFGALTNAEYAKFPEQDLNIYEALWCFIEEERRRWGTDWGSRPLAGKFGGDGCMACEELAFGFMLENEYHQVYRIWSRAWLVTK